MTRQKVINSLKDTKKPCNYSIYILFITNSVTLFSAGAVNRHHEFTAVATMTCATENRNAHEVYAGVYPTVTPRFTYQFGGLKIAVADTCALVDT